MQPLEHNRLQILQEERKRAKSLVEEDIRAKIGNYLHYQIPLHELFSFLNNPLLLWEMLHQAVVDEDFYLFVSRLHRILAFYSESSRIPECEVYPLLARLLATS